MDEDTRFMTEALNQAKKAQKINEAPIGAVIVKDNMIIAWGYNTREKTGETAGHAEMNAIRMANRKTGFWRLEDCVIYVTLEPCPMCAGAIIQSRIKRLVFGAYDKKAGACGSLTNLFEGIDWTHKTQVTGGILKDECSKILSDFFKELRENK